MFMGAEARAHQANRAVIEHICSTIWANEVLLSKAFRLFDQGQKGKVDFDDLKQIATQASSKWVRVRT